MRSMKQRNSTEKPTEKPEFVRKTVTIPAELDSFANNQTNAPEHAGNFSAYVRSLIIRDRNARQQKQAA